MMGRISENDLLEQVLVINKFLLLKLLILFYIGITQNLLDYVESIPVTADFEYAINSKCYFAIPFNLFW